MCLNSCSNASLRETDCLTRTTPCPLNLNVKASINLFGKSTPYSLTLVSTTPDCFCKKVKVNKNSLSSNAKARISGNGFCEILFQTFRRRFVEILSGIKLRYLLQLFKSTDILFLFNLMYLAENTAIIRVKVFRGF